MENTQILLDEMYDGMQDDLKKMGRDAITVREANLQRKGDDEVANYAILKDLLVITQDKGRKGFEILPEKQLLRIRLKDIARLVDMLLKEKEANKSVP